MTLDLAAQRLHLTLDTLTLPVTDYQLKTEMQVSRRTLCDGTSDQRLLGALPCSLTVSGTAVHSEGGGLLSALDAAMRAHTAFDFSFAGMDFSGMKLTAVSGAVKQAAGTVTYTVTMIGVTGS